MIDSSIPSSNLCGSQAKYCLVKVGYAGNEFFVLDE